MLCKMISFAFWYSNNYLSGEGVFWYFKFKTFKLLCFPGIPPKLLNLEIFKMGKLLQYLNEKLK